MHGNLGPNSDATGIEIERLTAVLENLGTNVLLADTDRTLTYMNPRSKETLGGLADVIQKEMGLAVEELLGGSLGRFHEATTQHIARLPANPAICPTRQISNWAITP